MKNNKTFRNNNEKKTERPAPVYSQFALSVKDALVGQITEFIEAGMTKDAGRELFDIGAWPGAVIGYEDKYKLYRVKHAVSFDRETGDFKRADCKIMVIDMTGAPAFYIECFINKMGQANVEVVELGEKGPVKQNTVRWNNRNTTAE